MCECELCWRRHKLVPHRPPADRIPHVRVDDLEESPFFWSSINTAGDIEDCLADFVGVAVRVKLWYEGDRVGFFLDDGVFVAVDCRIYAKVE